VDAAGNMWNLSRQSLADENNFRDLLIYVKDLMKLAEDVPLAQKHGTTHQVCKSLQLKKTKAQTSRKFSRSK